MVKRFTAAAMILAARRSHKPILILHLSSEKPWEVALRLLCLLSLVQDGVPHGYLESIRTSFLHQYGYHHLATLQRLEKLEVLYEAPPVIGTPQGKVSRNDR